jgi:hypothetical protein
VLFMAVATGASNTAGPANQDNNPSIRDNND